MCNILFRILIINTQREREREREREKNIYFFKFTMIYIQNGLTLRYIIQILNFFVTYLFFF